MKFSSFLTFSAFGLSTILFGRKDPILGTIILTDRCNLHCRHCSVNNILARDYPYRDIQSCRTEERKRMIPARSGGGEFRQFCFVFQDRAGAVRRFVYDPAQWDREIRALKERIRAAGAETERDT